MTGLGFRAKALIRVRDFTIGVSLLGFWSSVHEMLRSAPMAAKGAERCPGLPRGSKQWVSFPKSLLNYVSSGLSILGCG